jgi:ribosomal protein S7
MQPVLLNVTKAVLNMALNALNKYKILKRRNNNMPRRNSAVKRDVLPDPIYNSKLVTKFINQIMLDGKKGISTKIVNSAFDIIKNKVGLEPLDILNQALENAKPLLELKVEE